MAERFLSARVSEALQMRVKLAAASQGISIQDYLGGLVQNHLEATSQASPVASLSAKQQAVVSAWAAALAAKDRAAIVIFQMMELFLNDWGAKT